MKLFKERAAGGVIAVNKSKPNGLLRANRNEKFGVCEPEYDASLTKVGVCLYVLSGRFVYSVKPGGTAGNYSCPSNFNCCGTVFFIFNYLSPK